MKLLPRIRRLEHQLASPEAAQLWQICIRDDETPEAAIARHGIAPGSADLVLLHRYGVCAACVSNEGTHTLI